MVGRLTVHWHFVNLGTVVLLNISQDTNIIILYKVDGHTFTTISSRSTDSMKNKPKNHFIFWSITGFVSPVYVELTVVWKIIVDN